MSPSPSHANAAVPRRVAVIGGGITGLAACHFLRQQATVAQQPLDITLFEASDRCGGVFGTLTEGGYRLETGADMFITNKPGGIQLVRELGLESRLIETQNRYRRSLILRRGRPVPTPAGFDLMVPRNPWPLLKSPLLSPAGKLRVMAETLIPGAPREDETLASFATRRFGREAFERIIQPMVGGIYTADPQRLSLRATLPRFLEMEAQHGSLIRAAWQEQRAARKRQTANAGTTSPEQSASGARYGLFLSFDDGMSVLQDELVSQLERTCQLQRQTPVTELIPLNGNSTDHAASVTEAAGESVHRGPRYRLQGEAGQSLGEFDGVVLAVPAYRAAKLLAGPAPDLAAELSAIEYASAAIVLTGYRLEQISHPLDAFGLVIPAIERRRILAVSCTSRKFPNRAPEGSIQLRTFVGGALQQALLEETDERLSEIVREELGSIFGVSGEPELLRVVRWNRAMPQYHLGHVERVGRIRMLSRSIPTLELAGNAYEGVGIPDVIESARLAATRLWQELSSTTQTEST